MNTWTIPGRIIGGFVVVLSIAVLLGGLCLRELDTMNAHVDVLATNSVPSIVAVNRIATNTVAVRRIVRQLLLDVATDPRAAESAAAAAAGNLAALRREGDRLMAGYEPLIADAQERSLFEAARAARGTLLTASADALARIGAGKADEAAAMLRSRVDVADRDCAERFDRMIAHTVEVVGREAAAAGGRARWGRLAILATVGLSLLVTGLLVTGIVRSTIRGLRSLSDALEAGAAQTALAAASLAAVSGDLATGSGEQGAAVAETSASLEEMSAMIKSTADNAAQAKELATEASAAAAAGARTMTEMNAAMSAIEASSADVAKIVKDIDELAFQTNILALNAAVEAARAGEAGAGFAVVADEVRALAQRSAAAAKETAGKIEAAITNSRRGSKSCGRLGESLGDIVRTVAAADGLVAEIATAAKEQAQGIRQVGLAMAQMDQVTQGNSANAEQSAGAAEELKSQALSLQSTVEVLRTLAGHGAMRQAAAGTAAFAPTAQPARRLPAGIGTASQLQRIPMPREAAAADVAADHEDRHFKAF